MASACETYPGSTADPVARLSTSSVLVSGSHRLSRGGSERVAPIRASRPPRDWGSPAWEKGVAMVSRRPWVMVASRPHPVLDHPADKPAVGQKAEALHAELPQGQTELRLPRTKGFRRIVP